MFDFLKKIFESLFKKKEPKIPVLTQEVPVQHAEPVKESPPIATFTSIKTEIPPVIPIKEEVKPQSTPDLVPISNPLWRNFRFDPADTPDKQNYNALADIDPILAGVYAAQLPGVVRVNGVLTHRGIHMGNTWRMEMNDRGFLPISNSGALINIFTGDSAGPMMKTSLGFPADYWPPKAEFFENGTGFRVNGTDYLFKVPVLITTALPFRYTDEELLTRGWTPDIIAQFRDYQRG